MKQTLKIADRPAHVLGVLNDAGFQAHLVGGAVRNALMGVPVKDFDISTDAHPNQVTDLFSNLGSKVLPTGVEHGTVTVMFEGEPFEITTWRRDVATDGRRAVVEFASRLEDDALRRDFTMNALYASANGEIVDPTEQGLADIEQRRVRFIGDASERIREDALRILRYFRFSGRFSVSTDHNSADFMACKELLHLVDDLSRERVGQEMLQILALTDCTEVLKSMEAVGLLSRILDKPNPVDKKVFSALVRAEKGLRTSPCPIRRLSLLVSTPPVAELRLSKAQHRLMNTLYGAKDEGPKALGYRYGPEVGASVLLRNRALANQGVHYSKDTDLLQNGACKKFPLTGEDLKSKYRGPELGAALRHAEERWVQSDFKIVKAKLLEEA
tara:strand:+ start:2341 stop:3495 length:1155 start_codon:yes stop_codon:yes gene_type:complete